MLTLCPSHLHMRRYYICYMTQIQVWEKLLYYALRLVSYLCNSQFKGYALSLNILRDNLLSSLESIEILKPAKFVYLRDNLLSSLEGIEILKLVKVLDLSFNELLRASGRYRLNGSLLPIGFLIGTYCL
ncbi:187-kDa microtubule-associated protein AIR9, partial [Tanacetum coccineum]